MLLPLTRSVPAARAARCCRECWRGFPSCRWACCTCKSRSCAWRRSSRNTSVTPSAISSGTRPHSGTVLVRPDGFAAQTNSCASTSVIGKTLTTSTSARWPSVHLRAKLSCSIWLKTGSGTGRDW